MKKMQPNQTETGPGEPGNEPEDTREEKRKKPSYLRKAGKFAAPYAIPPIAVILASPWIEKYINDQFPEAGRHLTEGKNILTGTPGHDLPEDTDALETKADATLAAVEYITHPDLKRVIKDSTAKAREVGKDYTSLEHNLGNISTFVFEINAKLSRPINEAVVKYSKKMAEIAGLEEEIKKAEGILDTLEGIHRKNVEFQTRKYIEAKKAEIKNLGLDVKEIERVQMMPAEQKYEDALIMIRAVRQTYNFQDDAATGMDYVMNAISLAVDEYTETRDPRVFQVLQKELANNPVVPKALEAAKAQLEADSKLVDQFCRNGDKLYKIVSEKKENFVDEFFTTYFENKDLRQQMMKGEGKRIYLTYEDIKDINAQLSIYDANLDNLYSKMGKDEHIRTVVGVKDGENIPRPSKPINAGEYVSSLLIGGTIIVCGGLLFYNGAKKAAYVGGKSLINKITNYISGEKK